MKDCIFCKIVEKKISKDIIYEDQDVMAFEDIKPLAPFHLLIIPKKHIESINHLKDTDQNLIGKLILTAKKIAEDKKLKGYKLQINVGRSGGQIIDHLHIHLLANKE